MKKKITNYLNEREINILKSFSFYQFTLLSEGLISDKDLKLQFEYENTVISNPFVDECGMYEVDPVEYYGEAFINSDFLKIFI